MSICIKCKTHTHNASCPECPEGGDVQTDEYYKGYKRGIEEGKRQDREKLKSQDRGFIAATSDGVCTQGTGARWAWWLEEQDKKT
jgi:hypothetical protein